MATMRGTQNTYRTTDGNAIHFMTMEGHEWVDQVQYGKFQTYIRSDELGRPTAMGASIPVDLDGVFDMFDYSDQGGRFLITDDHRCNDAIPWTHVQFNYLAGGHPGGFPQDNFWVAAASDDPNAINNVIGTSTWFQRHFDVHFHLDTPEEANAITCSLGNFPPCMGTPEEMARFYDFPDSDYLPAGFKVEPLAYVPFMGAHWAKGTGQTYESFHDDYAQIMGTYAGRSTNWEGMVTASSLKQITPGSPKIYDLVVPLKVHKTGYYPTKIAFIRGAPEGLRADIADGMGDVYSIEMFDMEWRLGTDDEGKRTVPTEMSQCPPLDCSGELDFHTLPYCSQCGTQGVKAVGRKTGHKTKARTSCECQAFCQFKAEGFSFKLGRRQQLRNKAGKCVCLDAVKLAKSRYTRKYTSHIFTGNE